MQYVAFFKNLQPMGKRIVSPLKSGVHHRRYLFCLNLYIPLRIDGDSERHVFLLQPYIWESCQNQVSNDLQF